MSIAVAASAAALLLGSGTASAAKCSVYKGRFSAMPAPTCTSPVGLCTAGGLKGRLAGAYGFTMGTLWPAADGTIPSVFFFTGLSEISTRKGELVGTDSGSIDLNPFGGGKFASMITITDGTAGYAGAKGYLLVRGSLDFKSGGTSGDYSGEICVR